MNRTTSELTAYESGFAAGRAKGVEEAAAICDAHPVDLATIKWEHRVGVEHMQFLAKILATAIRSLIPTTDAEKENGNG